MDIIEYINKLDRDTRFEIVIKTLKGLSDECREKGVDTTLNTIIEHIKTYINKCSI